VDEHKLEFDLSWDDVVYTIFKFSAFLFTSDRMLVSFSKLSLIWHLILHFLWY